MKYIRKTWNELTTNQKAQLTKQMNLHKVPKEQQTKLIYQIYEDGSVRGYLFAGF
jgi:hypothetical protein